MVPPGGEHYARSPPFKGGERNGGCLSPLRPPAAPLAATPPEVGELPSRPLPVTPLLLPLAGERLRERLPPSLPPRNQCLSRTRDSPYPGRGMRGGWRAYARRTRGEGRGRVEPGLSPAPLRGKPFRRTVLSPPPFEGGRVANPPRAFPGGGTNRATRGGGRGEPPQPPRPHQTRTAEGTRTGGGRRPPGRRIPGSVAERNDRTWGVRGDHPPAMGVLARARFLDSTNDFGSELER